MASMTTAEVWQAFSDDLRKFIARRIAERDDVEDILQDTFVKVHAHLAELQDSERVAGWVYQIARNAIADHYRRQRPVSAWPDEEEEAALVAEVEEGGVEQEVVGWLKPMTMLLPEKYRQALWMTEFEGLTQAEMAARLGLSVSGAKSRVQRGRAMLKEQILDCCLIEFDRQGGIAGYRRRIDLVE